MRSRNGYTKQKRISVAMDGSFLGMPSTGIGSYVKGLSEALIAEQESLGLEMRILRPREGGRFTPGSPAHRFAWDSFGVANAMPRNGQTDLLHLPQMSAPLLAPAPLIVTIHDVIPFVIDEYHASKAMTVYLGVMKRTVRRARRIITPSLAAADDVARVMGIPRDRVHAIPEAADPTLVPDVDGEAARIVADKWGVTGPFIFNIGGYDRRKNVPMLIEAFAAALPQLPEDASLVIGGAPHTGNELVFPPVEPIIERHGLSKRVVLTGRISDDDRRHLYQAARVYATPSAYEGFGLTPLESMNCGVPAIVSNLTSLPEVVADAGLVVPASVEDFAQALVTLMNDDALHAELSRKSLQRSTGFTWARAAYLTADVYHRVASERGR